MSQNTPPKGRTGILNMGLTCYANSVIQALRHCGKLAWIFEEDGQRTLTSKTASDMRKKQEACCDSFGGIVKLLQNGAEKDVVRPADFWVRIHEAVQGTCYEHFRRKMPHDAHEFYTFLVDMLHESTTVSVDMQILSKEGTLAHQALTAWKGAFEKGLSPFTDLFYGLLHSRVTCPCGATTNRFETYNSLKVSIPDGATDCSLRELFESEYKPETIEGFSCDACGQKTAATRTTTVWSLPKNPVVVVKRFHYTGQRMNTRLQPTTTFNFDFLMSPESPERGNSYRLHAIVDHHGSSAGGHYTAQAMDTSARQWVLYDDETVAEITAPIFGAAAYILMFERVERT